MKTIAGSVRGKSRDLYDLHYMTEVLGVPVSDAVAWAQQMRPPDWKPPRRHRYVARAVRKPEYWGEMDDYLDRNTTLQESDQKEMASVMFAALREIQKLDKNPTVPSRSDIRSSGDIRSPDALPSMTRYCGHGGGAPCRRRVAPGKVCPLHQMKPRGRPT